MSHIQPEQRFGRLITKSLFFMNGPKWYCICDCGKECSIRESCLLNGATKSCGCININRLTSHGKSYHPLYGTWKNMMGRCNNPNDNAYKYYGARGIKVCNEWHDINNFIKDMGERPDGMTLDRRDNDKGYYKENCRWATEKEQQNNKRNSQQYDYQI